MEGYNEKFSTFQLDCERNPKFRITNSPSSQSLKLYILPHSCLDNGVVLNDPRQTIHPIHTITVTDDQYVLVYGRVLDVFSKYLKVDKNTLVIMLTSTLNFELTT